MIIIRILLFPLSVLYDLITRFRNHLFNIGSKPSFEFDTNVIGVGNLSVGGSGKTPMVEYLIRLLNEYKVTTLSRGYGRKSKGFRIANDKDSAMTIGDEPLQLFNKFESINVAVGEDRAMAIPEIIHHFPENEVIVLDDAFQHRYVKPNLNILLTDFNFPFFNDFVMPSGRLREARKGARRADIIVVTKCPNDLSSDRREKYLMKIQKYSNNSTNIFFTKIDYGTPNGIGNQMEMSQNLILFTGIANNEPLKTFLSEKYNLIQTISFSDHHHYSKSDFAKIERIFITLSKEYNCSIITTEKDMVKLKGSSLEPLVLNLPLFYIPIEVSFINDGAIFDGMVLNSIKRNQ